MASHDEICKMARIVTAAKTLECVLENPDRPVCDYDIVLSELKAALKEVDGWDGFDPRASLEYYRKQQENK